MVKDPAKILVITTYRHDNVQGRIGEGVAELLEEPVDVAEFHEIEFLIADTIELYWRGRELGEYKKIIMYGGVSRLLRIAHPLAVALVGRGIDVMTSGAETYTGVDKLAQNVFFSLYNIPIPKTYYANPKTMIERAGNIVGFPLILKDILTSQGDNNYLIHDQQELRQRLGAIEEDRYIAQEYIQNEGDIRVLINSQHDTFAFTRKATNGSHLNNTSAGGVATPLPNPDRTLLEHCKTILDERKVPLLGIDAIERDGEYFFLEANTQPMMFTGALTDDKQAFFKATINIK